MNNILIIGAGGHAHVVADVILKLSAQGAKLSLIGFLDDDEQLCQTCNDYGQILGTISEVKKIEHDYVVVAIGANKIRSEIYARLSSDGENFITLIHPSAVIASTASIGKGSVVFAGAVINSGAMIGENVIINTGATIDHHDKIGSHAHIAPGVHLGGNVTVEEGGFIGIGASIIPGCIIGDWSVVGAGSLVVKDIPSHAKAFGVPAKIKSIH